MDHKPFFPAFISALAISVILIACQGASGPEPHQAYEEPDTPKEITPDREWKALTTLNGSGNATSQVIDVTGTQVKILSYIENPDGDKQCLIQCYMVEATKTLEDDPQAEVEKFQGVCGNSEHIFYRGPGKFFFQVNAVGNWKLELLQK
jgi:hypothetical protein